MIGDSVIKIQSEKQSQNNAKVVDNCQTAIEQAYITLGEVCHFMCAGDPKLKALSKGALTQKTVRLVVECEAFAPLMTIGVFRSASAFLKELSNDNKYAAGLWSPQLQHFVQAFPVSPENVDFFWSVVEFWLNVTYESANFSAATLQILNHRCGELQQMCGGQSPVGHFKAHFQTQYKTVDEVKQDEAQEELEEAEEASDSDADMEEQEPVPEDVNAQTPDFKKWLVWTGAHCSFLRSLLKVADRVDHSGQPDGDSSDGMFEDIEIDSDAEDDAPVVDIDQQQALRIDSLQLISLPLLLANTEPLPQLSGFSSQAETWLDEIQETSFSIITSLLYSKLPQVKAALLP